MRAVGGSRSTSWRLPASPLSIRKALGRPPGAGRCLRSYRTNRPTGGPASLLTSVSVDLRYFRRNKYSSISRLTLVANGNLVL